MSGFFLPGLYRVLQKKDYPPACLMLEDQCKGLASTREGGGGHFHPLESYALAEAIAQWDNNQHT